MTLCDLLKGVDTRVAEVQHDFQGIHFEGKLLRERQEFLYDLQLTQFFLHV